MSDTNHKAFEEMEKRINTLTPVSSTEFIWRFNPDGSVNKIKVKPNSQNTTANCISAVIATVL